MNNIEEPIGKFVIENAKGVQTENGVYYHYSEVCRLLKKQLNTPAVVGQSEQLDCDHDWQSVFHHDNLIGRYCPECEELRAD